jgi:hypothetical protein
MISGAGCADADAADEPVDEDVIAEDEQAASTCRRSEPTVKIVSANIYEGGGHDNARDRFAALVRDIDAPVLAVQETITHATGQLIHDRLEAITGKAWDWQDSTDATWAIGTAIYWRTDSVRRVKSLGKLDLGKLEENGYTIRFHGALLESKGKRFAVFTGKLPWTNEAENFKMAPLLRDRVADAMKPYPNTVRVIAMDQNAPLRSRTWKMFDADYDDSGATLETHPSSGLLSLRKRLDYIWVDRGSGRKEGCAFTGPARRSMHFGSDHRFVWGDVYLR